MSYDEGCNDSLAKEPRLSSYTLIKTQESFLEEEVMSTTKPKPYVISKHLVMMAYKLVKANKGAAGVDQQSLDDFDLNLKDNLYKIWNRMSSGSYFPSAILAVPIPKKTGGERILGVPTVSDRIAQMVVKLTLNRLLNLTFMKIPTATDRTSLL